MSDDSDRIEFLLMEVDKLEQVNGTLRARIEAAAHALIYRANNHVHTGRDDCQCRPCVAYRILRGEPHVPLDDTHADPTVDAVGERKQREYEARCRRDGVEP